MLYSAISADIDILIAGNKDFSAAEVEKPEILTPSQFNEKYLSMEITAAYFILLPYNSLDTTSFLMSIKKRARLLTELLYSLSCYSSFFFSTFFILCFTIKIQMPHISNMTEIG